VAGGASASTAGIIGTVGSGAIGGLAGGLFVAPILAGIAAEVFRVHFPTINIFDLARAATFKRKIAARGLEGRVTTDPFTGNLALSTEDQKPILNQLLFEAAIRAQPSQPTSTTFAARQELIQGLAESAPARGFFASSADIPATLRGGVFRATADSPIQFVQTGSST
jgi:hypothetical protein